MVRRVALIGDVGGFADQLAGCLRQLGVCARAWPSDLHVIQLGDLVGGRDDVAVLELVEPHLAAGRWTQLVGNWELGAVGAFEISRAGRCADPVALDRFARWFDAGLVRYAAGVHARSGTWAVVTHAGVTSSWCAANAADVDDGPGLVHAVNGADPLDLHLGGEMCPLDTDDPQPPSPLWASAAELWSSWIDRRLPVAQVHGHSGAFSWRHEQWWPNVTPFAAHARADRTHRRVRFTPPAGEHPMWNIDAGLSARARHQLLHALVVDGVTEMA